MVRGTTQLKGHVFNALAEEDKAWVEAHIGFVDSAVDRIVPPSASATHDPLEVTVETFSEWIVDKTQFKGALPTIPGMELTDNLMAFVERKLFTLNTGHAITAYLRKTGGPSDDSRRDPRQENSCRRAGARWKRAARC